MFLFPPKRVIHTSQLFIPALYIEAQTKLHLSKVHRTQVERLTEVLGEVATTVHKARVAAAVVDAEEVAELVCQQAPSTTLELHLQHWCHGSSTTNLALLLLCLLPLPLDLLLRLLLGGHRPRRDRLHVLSR